MCHSEDKYSSPYERGRLALVAEMLPPGPGSALDLGCGSGAVSRLLADAGYSVIGVDSDETALAEARARVAAVRFIKADVFDADLGGPYDIVTACELLEHFSIDRQRALLKRVQGMMKPGGALVLSTPNRTSLMSLVGSIVYPLQGRRWDWGDATHVQVHSARSLLRLLHEQGFGIDNRAGFQLLLHRPGLLATSGMRPIHGRLWEVCYDLVVRARPVL